MLRDPFRGGSFDVKVEGPSQRTTRYLACQLIESGTHVDPDAALIPNVYAELLTEHAGPDEKDFTALADKGPGPNVGIRIWPNRYVVHCSLVGAVEVSRPVLRGNLVDGDIPNAPLMFEDGL